MKIRRLVKKREESLINSKENVYKSKREGKRKENRK